MSYSTRCYKLAAEKLLNFVHFQVALKKVHVTRKLGVTDESDAVLADVHKNFSNLSEM